jgi:hypothetical protein
VCSNTLGSSRALFGFKIHHVSETERDTRSPPRVLSTTKRASQDPPDKSVAVKLPCQRTRLRLLPPVLQASPMSSLRWESFAQNERKRRQKQPVTPGTSSPPLYTESSRHVRVGTISDLANVSFQEPPPSNQAAASQFASSPFCQLFSTTYRRCA